MTILRHLAPERAPIDFGAIAPAVVEILCGEPNPRLTRGARWRYGTHGSFVVDVGRRGIWTDFEAGAGGALLDLIVQRAGLPDRGAAVRWLRECGLLGDDGTWRPAHRPGRAERFIAGAGEEERARRRAMAARVWDAASPVPAGSVAAIYLRTRGCGHVSTSPALRFASTLTHPSARGCWPALVTAVVDAGGAFAAIQRTYLAPDGSGKGALDPPRASLGAARGGAVRLVEASPESGLLVGEGIETTAAAARLAGWQGAVWAALGTAGLRGLDVPSAIRHVVVAADRDERGDGQRAAAALARRLAVDGRRAEIVLPDAACGDFADELAARGGGTS